jgi:putative oxidoreductase
MSIFQPARSPWPERMLSVLRIVAALVFITFGTMKLFSYPPLPTGMPPIPLMSQMGLAGTLESIGGFLMLIGLFTRPVAFILSGEMAVAYFQGHYPHSFWPTTNMGTPAILYCFIFLYLVFAGAGSWSIDAMIVRSKAGKT